MYFGQWDKECCSQCHGVSPLLFQHGYELMIDCSRFKEGPRCSRLLLKTCLRDPKICWQTEGQQWRLPRLDLYLGSRKYRRLHPDPRLWDQQRLLGQLDRLLLQLNDRWLHLLLVYLDLADLLPIRQQSADLARLQPQPLRRVLLLVRLYLPIHLLDHNCLVYPGL